jgi:hypothetical protein
MGILPFVMICAREMLSSDAQTRRRSDAGRWNGFVAADFAGHGLLWFLSH